MIAVYVNELKEAAELTEKGTVIIYIHSESEWRPLREIPFDYNANAGLVQVRTAIAGLVGELKGCKVFVAKKVAGQLYYTLEANGFESFEAEGSPNEFLDSVNEAVRLKISEKDTPKMPDPESYYRKADKEGFYFLNMKEALYRDCALTSKRLLLPFLKAKEFKELEIICDHMPGWMDKELLALGLKSRIVMLKDNEYRVTVIVECGKNLCTCDNYLLEHGITGK